MRRSRSWNRRNPILLSSSLARSAAFLERRLRDLDPVGFRRRRAQLVGRTFAFAQSLLLDLQQSGRRISVRNVFRFYKRGCLSDLEVPACVCATSRRAFHHAPYCSCIWRLFAGAWTKLERATFNDGRVDRG